MTLNDQGWRELRLPHDWSIEGSFDKNAPTLGRGGYLPMGIGWYRKHFAVPEQWKQYDVTLRFGGIYRCSTVWVNGIQVGCRPNGYVEQNYSISPFLKEGEDNVIAVRVDNSRQPGARYYTGSGIYRNVTVLLRGKVQIAGEHPFITTTSLKPDRAQLEIEYGITNLDGREGQYTADFSLLDDRGNPVWRETRKGSLTKAPLQQKMAVTVSCPSLWDTEHPYLYSLKTNLYADGVLTDTSCISCGIRQMQWSAEKGFLLNGNKLLLKGVCLHQDNGCLGTVANKTAEKRKLSIMKQMGCNAVRVAHDPVSESFLALCDEMGILILDELFDSWFTHKTMLALRDDDSSQTVLVQGYADDFKQWYVQDVEETIRRDRVHPCVIAYSVGNELMEQRFCMQEAIPVLKDIIRRIKVIDPSRAVTCACCFDVQGTEESHFYDNLDLVGYNYAEVLYEEHLARFPARKIIGSENTSITPLQKRGTYDLNMLSRLQRTINLARGESVSSSEARHLCGEYTVRKHMHTPSVAGMFIWTGMDYLGEPTPYAWPSRSSYFGAVDTCGFPKDAFYFYQSCWLEKPMIHLLPHWNWNGMEEKMIDVLAYTNCPKAELFLNGISQGVCVANDEKGMHLHWLVPYMPGKLTVKGYSQAGEVCAEDTVITAQRPAAIRLRVEHPYMAERDALCYIRAEIVDAAGNIVPNEDVKISFQTDGGMDIAGVDNGDPTYIGKLKSKEITTLGGLCLCVVQHIGQEGVFSLRAVSGELKSDEVHICCK